MDEQIIFIIGISVGIISVGLVIFIALLIHFTRRLQGIKKIKRAPPAAPPDEDYFRLSALTTPSLAVTEYTPEDIADDKAAAEEVRNIPRDREYDNNWDGLSGSYDNNVNHQPGPSDHWSADSGGSSSNRTPDSISPAMFICNPRLREVLVGQEFLVYGPPVNDQRPGASGTPIKIVVGDLIVHSPGYITPLPSEAYMEDADGYMKPRPNAREV